ncbi:helix-turn-helix domain-containing protein [Cruoricaptor ignavus]|uniref:Helix-turn-helix domain-containing protein n=1 Tax=Cruoricaptor ignavus TaxID=1118202 RepID=A0A7M1T559_9FLAO|nr:helix-turn-helix domain-containing protein [Cruoricaptor ignavus]QOR74083.1 helix-turn-helix domain-containing protein [Cruoricaptor ignavus]
MEQTEISFENLLKAVAFLSDQIAEIKQLVTSQNSTSEVEKRIPIDIDAASKIIGKAKPTIYTLVRERKIPCYKNGKKLYFFEDELMAWISSGKRKTILEIEEDAEKSYRKKHL